MNHCAGHPPGATGILRDLLGRIDTNRTRHGLLKKLFGPSHGPHLQIYTVKHRPSIDCEYENKQIHSEVWMCQH